MDHRTARIIRGFGQVFPHQTQHGVSLKEKAARILEHAGLPMPETKAEWLTAACDYLRDRDLGKKRTKQKRLADRIAAGVPTKAAKQEFYASWEWTALRMQVLKEQGRRCLCCGAAAGDDVGGGVQARIVVDHIKPLSLHWDMRLDRSNLQVLCHVCNQGKSNVHEDDFRAA